MSSRAISSGADSLGNNGRLEPGAAQVMTFSHGGDLHSERNGSQTEGLRFIQFWILPSVRGLETSVQQRQFDVADRTGGYLYVTDGAASAGDDELEAGDALKIEGPQDIELRTRNTAELILIDVPLTFEPVGVWAGER
jgi:quercetin 2,3-dioxygenase